MSTDPVIEGIDLKMRKLIDKWSPTVLVLFCLVKLLQIFKKLGFSAKEDGWRKTARIYLRTEHSKYSLAAFRLDLWSDLRTEDDRSLGNAKKHIIERLAAFLKQHPTICRQLQWNTFSARGEEKSFVDIIHAEFNNEGSMEFIETRLDSNSKTLKHIDPELETMLNRNIINIYNDTRDFDDKNRPLIMKKRLLKWLFTQRRMSKRVAEEAKYYIERVLSGSFIHFEELPSSHFSLEGGRFDNPDFIIRKHPGFGILNILCRFDRSHTEADLWFQINHIPVDGVPMQEVLQDLKDRWGTCGDLVFPTPSFERTILPIVCSSRDSKKRIYHVIQFVDFRNLLRARRELNKRYAGEVREDITVVSLLAWGLAHHKCFDERKFTFPVDLSACMNRERTLGFVVIRPGVYFDKDKPKEGFINFQREFNRRLQATRARRSESYELLEIFALTPPFIYAATLKLMSAALAEITGTVGITIIKDADLFIAPLSDTHPDGFLALGNLLVPTVEGGMVGAVSVKGSKDRVRDYLKAVNEVVTDFYNYV
jgi:hypothetical protein